MNCSDRPVPNQDHSRRRRDDDNRCEGNSTEAPRLGSRMNIGIFGLWGMNVPGVQFGGFETAFTAQDVVCQNVGYLDCNGVC